MDFLTRLLAVVSPKWAYSRACWQQALARGSYTAADRSPRAAGWTTQNGPAELHNQGERDIVRARARDLERNSDILLAQVLAFERNVVGTGVVLQARVLGRDGEEDDRLNDQIERLWKAWCKPGNCELSGRLSLAEVQQLIVRRRFIDGGILLLKVYEAGRFCLQLLEVDDLDTAVQQYGGNRVIGGVEVDGFRRAVAYHIRVYDAWGFSVRSERVEAQRVIYLPQITRPSQIREFPACAASLARIDDANELIDAGIEKENVLCHLSLWVRKTLGTLTGAFGLGRGAVANQPATEPAQPPSELLKQGSIVYLNPGEEVGTISAQGSSSVIDPLVKTTQRLAGSGVGLSYEVTARDMSQVTYSSARQGLLEDQRTYRMMQSYLIEHFCDVVYEAWLDWMVLSGQLELPGYFVGPQRWRGHVWIPSGWDWIDPVKEVNAMRIALETNQITLQEACASKGRDWKEVVRQRAAERRLATQLMGEDSKVE